MNTNAATAHAASRPSWLRALSDRFAPPPGDSALVCGVIARGRRTLHGVVVLTPLPQLWFQDDEDEDEDEDTECDHRDAPPPRSEMA